MNDHDLLTDRLHELGRRAPVPAVALDLDIRRGRTALRRRHARRTAGVTTAFVAVGAVAAIGPAFDWRGDGGGTTAAPGGSTASDAPSDPSPTPAAEDPCAISAFHPSVLERLSQSGSDPEITATARAYQQAAAEILDPAGNHVDLTHEFNKVGGGASASCDPASGLRLTGFGTHVGWASGDAFGVIEVDVAPTHEAVSVPYEGRWSAYEGQLPTGVVTAQVAEHGAGGDAVLVERADGLTVVVATSGTWPNNMPPGSPVATDLPDVDRLLALAASPRLVFPGR